MRADVEDVRVLPPGGLRAAAFASLEAPCELGACLRIGGELWLDGRFRLAAALPLRAAWPSDDDADAEGEDGLALGAATVELGARLAFGQGAASWVAVELGASAPTGTAPAGALDVRRFALAPWSFDEDASALWLDASLGYGRGGQFAAARLGVVQALAPVEVSSDGQEARSTRLRVGIVGGTQVAPAWLFEAGALATAGIAPTATYLLFHDDQRNVLAGAAYQLFAGLRGRGERSDLGLHLRIPFWQARAGGSPRPPSEGSFWIFLEATGRFWF